jgi:hypothetical protein
MEAWLSNSALLGTLGISEQLLMGNVLDLAKYEKQRTGHRYPAIFQDLYKNGVLRAHTLGLWPWSAGMYFTRGFTYGGMRMALDPHLSPVASSLAAGAAEGALSAPWNMARIRLAEQHRFGPQRGLVDWRTLGRSLPFVMAKRSVDWGTRSLIHQQLQRLECEGVAFGVLGFATGVLSTGLTMPLDRLLPVLMQQHPPPLRQWWRQQRWSSLMAGSGARAMHGGWHTMFIFGGLQWCERRPEPQ